MKKRLSALLASLLCLLLLTGCSRYSSLPDMLDEQMARIGLAQKRIETIERDEDSMPRFCDMPYERPELSELEARIERAAQAMNAKKPYREVEALLDACFDFYYHFDTMYVIADIRCCQNLNDEYYAQEYLWCSENYASLQQAIDNLYYTCAASPMAKTLEQKYFWEGFVEQYSDRSQSVYSDEMVALMQEESALIAEYRALSADPVIEFRGKERSINELIQTLSGSAYNQAVTAYYEQYNERYADLFIRLIANREQQAALLGYDSYEQMQYLYGYERDYTSEQAALYLEDIRQELVPLYRDLAVSAVPNQVWIGRVSEATLRELIGSAAENIGGKVADAFRFMTDYELCDLSVDARKANMSFQTYLSDYEAPFLFLDADGSSDDILSLAHEFGHYCDAYVNENAYETIDLAEVYSQAMEYLMLSQLREQLDEDEVENLARVKMIDTVEMYVQQASFAAFEHEVYALSAENLNAEAINEIARRTAIDYGYYDGYYDAFYALSWVDIVHFFEQPFYVVSYPVSNDLAMQIYALEQAQSGAGTERYLSSLERDFTGLMGLVDEGGFQSPFDAGRISAIAALAREVLGL